MFRFLKRAAVVGTLVASMVTSVLTATPAAAAGTATLSFNPSSTTVGVGASFSVPVQINMAGGNTNGVQFGVIYNPAVLNLTGATDGTFFSSYAAGIPGCSVFNQPWFPGTTGVSAVGADSLLGAACGAGPTGTGTMATFNFTALAGVNAVTQITFTALSPTGTVVSGATTTVINTINMTVGTPPAAHLAVTGATTTGVGTPPTQFNVSYAVANTGTAASDNATHTLTVTVTTGATTLSTDTFTLPLAAGASTATKTDGPFTLVGTLETITITADSAGTAGGPATATTAYQFSALSSTGNTALNATLAATLALTAPPSLNNVVLTPGTTTTTPDGNLGVSSNVNFQVTADGTNAGHFAQFNGTAFLTPLVQLISALVVQTGTAPQLTLSGVPQNLIAGTAAGEPVGGYQFPTSFIQAVATNDAPVNAPNTYNIVVTFAATGSF
jgi:hypothetical protein